MKLTRATFSAYRLPLCSAVVTATTTQRIRHGWRIELADEKGRIGLGDVAPWPGFGQAPWTSLKALRRLCGVHGTLQSTPFEGLESFLQETQALSTPEVRHGVECALLDLLAKRDGVSLREWLNPDSLSSVPVCQLVDSVQQAVAACRAGISALKLKVGASSLADDIAKVRAVRNAVGPQIAIRIDANGAWSYEQAAQALAQFVPLQLEWVEQPLPLDRLNDLQSLRAEFGIPIAIDEGLTCLADLEQHIASNALDVAVIKPMFVGGILVAQQMAQRAGEAGLKVSLTTALESNVGRTAALHLAAALGADCAAFGLGTAVQEDPFAAAPVQNGRIYFSSAPGLGLCESEPAATIPSAMQRFAQASPNRAALITKEGCLSAAELGTKAQARAGWLLEQGVQAGDLVALLGPFDEDWVVSWHALGRLGAVVAPLSPRLATAQISQQLNTLEPEWSLALNGVAAAQLESCDWPWLEAPQTPVPVLSVAAHRPRLNQSKVILLSSGSTGAPKPIMLSHSQMLFSAMGSALRLGHQAEDCWLCCLPLNHVGGLSILTRCAWYGTTVLLHPNFDAGEVADALDSSRVSLVSLVPNMLERVLDARGDRPFPKQLRVILLGGASVSNALLNRCKTINAPIAVTWGMTESASQVATTRPGIIEPAGCVGTPLAFAEVSVTGNRLGVSGPIVGGSIITQDMGRIDEQGRIWVEGRCDDVINSGGELISPAEVEAVLTAHPSVSDAAVVGLPDPTWGERTVAAVVTKSCDNESLRLWCETQLAAFKIPKQFHQIESIPRTELGKLSRATVREQLMNQMEIKK